MGNHMRPRCREGLAGGRFVLDGLFAVMWVVQEPGGSSYCRPRYFGAPFCLEQHSGGELVFTARARCHLTVASTLAKFK